MSIRFGSSKSIFQCVAERKAGIGFFLLFAIATGVVFSEVFQPWMAITSPDGGPYYVQKGLVETVDLFLSGGRAFTPFVFLGWHASPLTVHELRYSVCMLLFALSGAYYLRTQGVGRLPAYGAGLLLAFSGYTFTLFNAGHLGFFCLMAGFFWSFGLLNRCMESGRLFYFAMLGAVVMWAQPGQPDVWMLFCMIFAAYALMKLWRDRKHALRLIPKFVLTAVVAGLVGAPGVQAVLTQHLAGRDKQIAEMSARSGPADQAVPQQKNNEDRWNFATGWSLPPADCVELFVPGFFGNDSMRPPYPYWGGLGRPHNYQKGQMMPNYRQHTTYLGLVTVLLAICGFLAWLSQRRRPSSAADLEPQSPAAPRAPSYADVPFWAAVWVICLVLALGRYTPVYRLFYSLPYMDYLRAPVKFLHFTELATGLLAGFGMHALLHNAVSKRTLRFTLVAAIAMLSSCLVLSLVVAVGGTRIETHIRELGLGLGQFAASLRAYTQYNCLRSAGVLAAVCALLVFGWVRKPGLGKAKAALCLLICVGVFDLAAVARRYVIAINVAAHYAENALLKNIEKRSGGIPANTANYLPRNMFFEDWLNTCLSIHGYSNIVPASADPESKEYQLALAFQSDPVRYWECLGVRFIVLQNQQAESLVQSRLVQPAGLYDLENGTIRSASAPSPQSVVLLERPAAGFPALYFNWKGGVSRDRQVSELKALSLHLPVADAPSPPEANDRPPRPVTFQQMRGQRNVFVSRATLDIPQPALLIWNERYAENLRVCVDGAPVPLYQANGLWCAVSVPAGSHTLTCRTAAKGYLNLLSASVSLAVCLAGMGCCAALGRDRGKACI